jgi:hypothetical protein
MAPVIRGACAGSPVSLRIVSCLLLAGAALNCGKKGNPLPPLRRNPEPITRLELAQRGAEVELAFVTPTRTVDGALLPVLDVELFISSEPGVLAEVAEPVRLKAAPGERIAHTQALPEPGTPLRFAVRTIAAGKRSALSPESLLLVKAPPPPPSDVSVRLTDAGLSLTWTECVATTPNPPLPAPIAAEVGGAEAAEGAAAEDGAIAGPAGTSPPPAEPDSSQPPESGSAAQDRPEASVEPGTTAAEVAGETPPGERGDAIEPAVPVPPEAPASGAEPVPGGAGAAAAPAAPPPEVAPSAGVRIYRRTAEVESLTPLLASPLATEAYLDAGLAHGVEYCYTLRTVLSGTPTVEGSDSVEVCSRFEDRVPPPAPEGLSALRRDGAIVLAWSPLRDAAERPARLSVYRSLDAGPLERVAELEPDATRWTDASPPTDVVVEYALTASDACGNESPPSRRSRLIP